MLIDWFTVGAQTLNFIVLVWLMKRFLYQPILNAIDAREQMIASQLAHADKISTDAIAAKNSFDEKVHEFNVQRAQLLLDATTAAHSENTRLEQEARELARQLENKQQQALRKKMQQLHASILTATQKVLFAMAKNALRDLAAVEIEAQMVKIFLERLQNMDSGQKSKLTSAINGSQLSIVSSNHLSSDQQNAIEKTLKALSCQYTRLEFEQSAALIGGIELNANGFKIGWSVAEYLHALEESFSTLINDPARAHREAIKATKARTPEGTPTGWKTPIETKRSSH